MPKKKPEHADLALKKPTEVHEYFAAFINAAVGVEVDAETVALVQRAYPLYLKSPDVAAAREAEKAARAEQKAQAERVKEARLKARLAKIEAQRQKTLKALGLEPDAEVVEAEDRFVPVVEAEPEPEEITLPADDDDDEDVWDDEDEEEDF